ncbi:hypothetical protein [Parvularcula sp. IMCC14364]|uniref:hypothetical protein n=1 Tax=Parvularcula sp. IMCC14364 TaxID=3067902 RepID=UPI002740FF68|nr:hypothetical protein [Parvularcula sp. IMCC14364]
MFSLKKKARPEEPAVDFSRPLQRALNNPLKSKNDPASIAGRIDPDLRLTLSAIEASFFVIDRIREILTEAAQLVLRAKDVDDLAARAMLAEQYDELRQSVCDVLHNADEDAQHLIGPEAMPLTATLNFHSIYTVDPVCLNIEEAGLNLPPPREAFAQTGEIAQTLGHLEKALEKIDRTANYYMKDAKFLITRLEKIDVI